MNRSKEHTALCHAIMAELGSLEGLLVCLNPCGQAHYLSGKGDDYFVPYGFPSESGGPDLLVVLAPYGTLVGLEVKTGKATTSPEQKMTHAALERFGVRCFVVRSVNEAKIAVARARLEANQ